MSSPLRTESVKLSLIKPNPSNPRFIRDHKFKKLVRSIKDFPQMLEIRPIVVNDDMVVLGGNMRLKALKECGYEYVPIIKVSELTEEQQKEFIVKDNIAFGEWDIDILANEYDLNKLMEWGMSSQDIQLQNIEEMLNEEDYDNDPIYPLAPRMSEKHDYVMILVDNEIEYAFIKTFFNLSNQSDYKSGKVGQGRVITFEAFKKIIDERSGKVDNIEPQEG